MLLPSNNIEASLAQHGSSSKVPKRRVRNLFQPMIEVRRRAHDGDMLLRTKKGQQPGVLHRLTKRMRVRLFTLLIMIGIPVLYVIPHVTRTLNVKIPPSPARRFPEFGTLEFAQKCPWVMAANKSNNNNDQCITYVTPNPESHEGVAEWAIKIVIGLVDLDTFPEKASGSTPECRCREGRFLGQN
jgi:hypothetical protein